MPSSSQDVVRFRCPNCLRGLRVPESAIGRRLICPFCQSVYKSDFAVESASPKDGLSPDPIPAAPNTDQPFNVLTRWMPTKSTITTAAAKVSQSVRSGADMGAQAVKSAANSTAAAVTSTAKKAAAAATPLTQVVTGLASVVLPGAGELMTGKTIQGYCTMAAFIGATAAATAATGGAWIAAPIAISVFSASQGALSGRKLGKQIKESLESNTDELVQIAQQVREQANSMSEEDFERLMLEREEAELKHIEAETPKRRVVLVRVGSKAFGKDSGAEPH